MNILPHIPKNANNKSNQHGIYPATPSTEIHKSMANLIYMDVCLRNTCMNYAYKRVTLYVFSLLVVCCKYMPVSGK